MFGGAFNPIHLGHLRAAEEIAEALELERVHFVVSAAPPHKDTRGLIAPEDRLAMVTLACAGNPRFAPSRVELERRGPSYTIDTLRHFAASHGRSNIFFITGQDAFEEIGVWKEARAMVMEYNFAVAARPGGQWERVAETLRAITGRAVAAEERGGGRRGRDAGDAHHRAGHFQHRHPPPSARGALDPLPCAGAGGALS